MDDPVREANGAEVGIDAAALTLRPLDDRPAVFTPAQVRELDRATIEDMGVPGTGAHGAGGLGSQLAGPVALPRQAHPHRLRSGQQRRRRSGGGQATPPGRPPGGLRGGRRRPLRATSVRRRRASTSEPPQKAGVNLRVGDGARLPVGRDRAGGRLSSWAPAPKGNCEGRLGRVGSAINAAGARGVPVVAVDVPSGVDATTGSIAAGTVAADVTITFHAAKSGLVCPPGSEAAGEVLVWDIGIPGFLEPEPDLWVVTAEDVNIPGRRVDDHKYRAGYVAVLGGLDRLSWRRVAGVPGRLPGRGGVRAPADGCRRRERSAGPAGGGGACRRSGRATAWPTPVAALAVLADERLGAAGRRSGTWARTRRRSNGCEAGDPGEHGARCA